MSQRCVFVIGASGNVGKATVKALAANYGAELDIRAGVRKPEKVDEFNSLQGVTVVKAEMGKRDELIAIFKDVAVLFIVVPGSGPRVELTQVTAQAAKEAGVKHILVLGAPGGADRVNTVLGKQMYDIECSVSELGPNYTILRLPWFMDNYFAFKPTIDNFSAIYAAVEPTKRFQVICMDDFGLAAAMIMYSPEKHAGKAYTMVSDRHTYQDIAKAFSEALGKPVKYVQQSYADTKAGMMGVLPEWQIDGLIEYFKQVNAGDHETGDDSHFTMVTGKQPTNVATWVQRYAAFFK